MTKFLVAMMMNGFFKALVLLLACFSMHSSYGFSIYEKDRDDVDDSKNHAPCHAIRFSPGRYETVLRGEAPMHDLELVSPFPTFVCYALKTLEGQRVTLKVLKGKYVAFTVIDLADVRGDYTFETRERTYFTRVFQIYRSFTPEHYEISVRVQ